MVFIFTIYWWKFRKQPLKEVIDNYMAHCRRSKSVSRDFENDDEDDADDDQTRQEFEDFKRWLDETNPSSSQTAPSSVATCPKCKAKDCQWFPAESFLKFFEYIFSFSSFKILMLTFMTWVSKVLQRSSCWGLSLSKTTHTTRSFPFIPLARCGHCTEDQSPTCADCSEAGSRAACRDPRIVRNWWFSMLGFWWLCRKKTLMYSLDLLSWINPYPRHTLSSSFGSHDLFYDPKFQIWNLSIEDRHWACPICKPCGKQRCWNGKTKLSTIMYNTL